MEIIKVSANCYYSKASDEGDRSCIGYIKINDSTGLIIDAGNSQRHMAQFLASLISFSLPLPKYCILTHSHWDHVFGIALLNIPIICSKKTNEKINIENAKLIKVANDYINAKTDDERNNIFKSLSAEEKFCIINMIIEYKNTPINSIKIEPTLILSNQETLEFDIPVTIIPIKCPHSEDSIIVYVESEKVVYVGDGLYRNFNDEYANINGFKNFPELYSYFQNLDFEVCVFGHTKHCSYEKTLMQLSKNYSK